MLNIIQNHYPERLGRALIINVPFLINAFFKLIMPFVDPVTREKVRFNPDVIGEGLFDKDNLMTQWWGGNREFEWDHEKYWPVLVKMCDERRARQKERWTKLGAKIGLDEWDIKAGDELLTKASVTTEANRESGQTANPNGIANDAERKDS
jgi:hypothetical protein